MARAWNWGVPKVPKIGIDDIKNVFASLDKRYVWVCTDIGFLTMVQLNIIIVGCSMYASEGLQ